MDPLSFGVLGVAVLILVKEAGLPVPVPGDLLVVGAGVAASQGEVDAWQALVAILAAGLIGGVIQFTLVRGAGRDPLLGILRRVGVSEARLDLVAARLRRQGARGVAVARATPGVRIVAIAAAGLAALPVGGFVAGLALGNTVFVGAHFAAGLLVGPSAVAFVAGAAGPMLVGLAGLAVVGSIGWWLIRRARRGPSTAVGDWADACCPACLALGALGRADA
jgi:membrane protein DedA with SNARE-associated domain